jgi:hypothetical protein
LCRRGATSSLPDAVEDLAFNLEVTLVVLELSCLEELFNDKQEVAIVYFVAKLALDVVPNGFSHGASVVCGLAQCHGDDVEVPVDFGLHNEVLFVFKLFFGRRRIEIDLLHCVY